MTGLELAKTPDFCVADLVILQHIYLQNEVKWKDKTAQQIQ